MDYLIQGVVQHLLWSIGYGYVHTLYGKQAPGIYRLALAEQVWEGLPLRLPARLLCQRVYLGESSNDALSLFGEPLQRSTARGCPIGNRHFEFRVYPKQGWQGDRQGRSHDLMFLSEGVLFLISKAVPWQVADSLTLTLWPPIVTAFTSRSSVSKLSSVSIAQVRQRDRLPLTYMTSFTTGDAIVSL